MLRDLEQQEQLYQTNESAERVEKAESRTSESFEEEKARIKFVHHRAPEEDAHESQRKRAMTSMNKISVQFLELDNNLGEYENYSPKPKSERLPS